MKKKFYRFLIFTLLLVFGFITYLSTIGIKTDAFNNQISEEIKKINNQLELDLNKINIILDPFKFKLVLKTIGADLKNKDKLIKLESIRTNIDIKTFINKKFSLSELNINSRTIDIKNLISFIRSIEDNPQIFILEKFVKKGYLIVDINLKNQVDIFWVYGIFHHIQNILVQYRTKVFLFLLYVFQIILLLLL